MIHLPFSDSWQKPSCFLQNFASSKPINEYTPRSRLSLDLIANSSCSEGETCVKGHMSTLFELKTKRGRQVCFWKLQCICRGFYCHDILPLPSLYLMQVSCYFISTGENDMVKIIDTLYISMESLSLFAIYYYILAFIRQTIHNTWVKLPLVVIWLMVMASFLWWWTDQIPISNNAFVHTTDLLWELIRHT